MSTKKEIVRYLAASPVVGATDIGIYYLLALFLPVAVSKGISYVCAGVVAYLLNKNWTFRTHNALHPVTGRYWMSEIVLLGYNVAANRMVLDFWPRASLLAPAIAAISAAILNFFLKKYWVFKTS